MRRTATVHQQASSLIEKVTARVFCQLEGRGGNPVTIFSSSSTDSHHPIRQASTRVRLAQTCEWESVMVDESNRTMAFYMPTGEQVSFCAHAAMGGAIQLAQNTEERFTFSTASSNNNSNKKKNANAKDDDNLFAAIVHENDIVSLEMETTCGWRNDKIQHPPVLHRLLRDALGLQSSALVPPSKTTTTKGNHDDHNTTASLSQVDYPTFRSVDVVGGDDDGGRPKTIVYVNSIQALNQQCHAPSNPDAFRQSCDALDPPTTGLYLYSPSPKEDGAWECRQFPRASGYPEDPATGIAAAALAVALRMGTTNADSSSSSNGIILPHYKFYQGTAMRKTSLIMVDDLQIQEDKEGGDDSNGDENDERTNEKRRLSYRLLGRVEIDDQEEINI